MAAATISHGHAFEFIGQLLNRVFTFNEIGVPNPDQFAAKLETDTRRRFRHQLGTAVSVELERYFSLQALRSEAESRALNDAEENRVPQARTGRGPPAAAPMMTPEPPEVSEAREFAAHTRPESVTRHELNLAHERLGVLEVLLVNLDSLPSLNRPALDSLLADLRAIFSETNTPLDIQEEPPRLVVRSIQVATTGSTETHAMPESPEIPNKSPASDEAPVLVQLEQQLVHARHALAGNNVAPDLPRIWVRRTYRQLSRVYGPDAPVLALFPLLANGVVPDPRRELTQRLAVLQQITADLKDVHARSRLALQRNRVFIGHGRSALWRQLKDFLAEELHLAWDEFNRESTAGLTTTERLNAMLAQAVFAFLVMSGEDEHADEQMHARENVVHEVGLFQGHLGPRRAIVLLEEGCAEFSNIHGLTQIRFPKGDLSARFEEIRRVLKREGLL